MKFLNFYIRHLYLPPCRQRATKEIKIRRRKLPSLLLSLSLPKPPSLLPSLSPLSAWLAAGAARWHCARSNSLPFREQRGRGEREGPPFQSIGLSAQKISRTFSTRAVLIFPLVLTSPNIPYYFLTFGVVTTVAFTWFFI